MEMNKDDFRGVWVAAEQRRGEIHKVTYELLGKGRELADRLGTELAAVLLGENIKEMADGLIKAGADKVYVIDDPALKDFNDEAYAHAVAEAAKKYKPEIMLTGATAVGRLISPGFRLNWTRGLPRTVRILSLTRSRGTCTR